MSGETEQNISGWTVDTLHAHIYGLLVQNVSAVREIMNAHDVRYEQRFNDQDKAVQAALAAQEKAVNAALVAADRAVAKAETASEKRFDAVNEFRATLADQARDLMPRLETEQALKGLDAKIADLGKRIDATALRIENSAGKGVGREQVWAYVLGAVGLLGGIVGIVLAFGVK